MKLTVCGGSVYPLVYHYAPLRSATDRSGAKLPADGKWITD